MTKVLFVEDNELYADTVMDYFQNDSLQFELAKNRGSALELFYKKIYDLFLVDICIPMKDGFRLIQEIRAYSDNPILALTSLTDSSYAIQAFSLGCDDFIRKTSDLGEVKKRIIAKKLRQFGGNSEVIDIGDGFEYCILCKSLYRNGTLVKTTTLESNILSVLVEKRNRYIEHDLLHKMVWPASSGESSALRFHIMSLRKILGNHKIESTRCLGYKLTT